MNAVHKEALQKNHRLLINTLDLSRTDVLDLLLQEDVISSGEQDDILSRTTPRDQNSRLLFVLKRRGGAKKSFDNFLKALNTNYDFIAKELKATVENVEAIHTTEEKLCSHCLLVNNLIPADVSHTLYELGVISDDDLELLNNKNIPRTERVHTLLLLLDKNPDQEMVLHQFCVSLKTKYNYIQTDRATLKNFLKCSCSDVKETNNMIECTEDVQPQSCIFDSSNISGIQDITEQGTAFFAKRSGVSKCEDITDGSKSDIATLFQHLPKEEALVETIKPINEHTYLRICTRAAIKNTGIKLETNFVSDNFSTDITSKKTEESEESSVTATYNTQETAKYLTDSFESSKKRNNIRRYHPGRHKSRSLSNLDSGICKHVDSSHQILQNISRTLPNNKKLMRMCTKLWDKLFFLRERGDWETFNTLSIRAFEKFSANPDIQVLMYRSEMCVSTFYKNDKEKADDMFEKAMEILPQTSMPIWHLARLLPLKVELCTRAKEFEEASSLLEQAHQAIITLGPCLSTGAVHFFEAIYLGNILRCTRNGTSSFASVSEKVKKCFLTAIEHYEQEQFFAIQSFLNQVYLFLALFCLGVYFKDIGYIKMQTVAKEDIALAEYYLNLFENKCWENSTNWSRMLFFIAKGEQHKLRNNFSRCLDYYTDALQCAENGKFVEYLEFVERNIQWAGDKIMENSRLQESNPEMLDDILQGLSDSSEVSSSGDE